MRRIVLGLSVLLAAMLTGCNVPGQTSDGSTSARGRYVGVGIYSPGRMWRQIARPAAAASDTSATLRDDEQVIVVVDSHTGELRQCGNLSGSCTTMNPWTTAPGARAPTALAKHAEQLDAEDAAEGPQ